MRGFRHRHARMVPARSRSSAGTCNQVKRAAEASAIIDLAFQPPRGLSCVWHTTTETGSRWPNSRLSSMDRKLVARMRILVQQIREEADALKDEQAACSIKIV